MRHSFCTADRTWSQPLHHLESLHSGREGPGILRLGRARRGSEAPHPAAHGSVVTTHALKRGRSRLVERAGHLLVQAVRVPVGRFIAVFHASSANFVGFTPSHSDPDRSLNERVLIKTKYAILKRDARGIQNVPHMVRVVVS